MSLKVRKNGQWVTIGVGEKGFKGDAELLKQYMKERLSKHEYPRDITFVKDLPKTPAGKVNRKVLRDGMVRD